MTNLARRIFSQCIPVRDDLSIESHAMALSAVEKLGALITRGYSTYDLDYIIRAKAIGYYTGFDVLLNDCRHSAAYLKRFIGSRRVSNALALRAMALRRYVGSRNSMTWGDETPVTVSENAYTSSSHVGHEACNLLFANLQTYLRVMVLYMRDSELNNVLVVPRSLADVGMLKQVDPKRLIYFDDFVSPSIIEETFSVRKHFEQVFRDHRRELQDAFTIEGQSFFPIIEQSLSGLFQHVLPESFRVRLTVDRILDHIKPSIVIGARVRRLYDRAFYAAASSRGVPAFVLMHSDIGSDVRFIHTMGHFTRLTGVFAWGDRQAQLIRNDQFSDVENVYVTGSPLFVRAENSDRSGKSRSKKRIIYAGTSDDLDEVREITQVIRTSFPDTELIVKVHPGLDHQPYERYCRAPNVTLVSGAQVLEDLLNEVDLLITTISESSLQSMIRGIATLYLSLKGKWDPLLNSIYTFDAQEEQALVVKSGRALSRAIEHVFESDNSEAHPVQSSFLARRIRLHERMDGPVRTIDDIITASLTELNS